MHRAQAPEKYEGDKAKTMSLTLRRTPLIGMDSILESLERAMDDQFLAPTARGTSAHPLALDLFERDNTLFLRASVPGFKPDEIDVSMEKNILTIRGSHIADWQSEDTKVYRREIAYGEFTRSVRVPQGYVTDAAEANFENGILTIRIPRAEPATPETRKIEVRTVPQAALPSESSLN